jgi:hypothetical protein
MWNVNTLDWQKENNKAKYLQYEPNKRISVLHILMNENVIEKCTCLFHIKHHIQMQIYVHDLGIS